MIITMEASASPKRCIILKSDYQSQDVYDITLCTFEAMRLMGDAYLPGNISNIS